MLSSMPIGYCASYDRRTCRREIGHKPNEDISEIQEIQIAPQNQSPQTQGRHPGAMPGLWEIAASPVARVERGNATTVPCLWRNARSSASSLEDIQWKAKPPSVRSVEGEAAVTDGGRQIHPQERIHRKAKNMIAEPTTATRLPTLCDFRSHVNQQALVTRSMSFSFLPERRS